MDGWREQVGAEEGGGLLLDLGSHLVDQALQLFGPVSDVYAEVDVRREGAVADDDDFLALEHESGVRSHLWMSTLAADRAPRFRVLGDRGAFTKHGIDIQEEQLRAGRTPGERGFGDEPLERWGRLVMGEEARGANRARLVRVVLRRRGRSLRDGALRRSILSRRWPSSRSSTKPAPPPDENACKRPADSLHGRRTLGSCDTSP